ncbi:hypothetical protein SAMN04487944_12812 [Gracilibacillus ureilyticus]|uniref:Methyltransferase domain-containing protein n=1 Tax=Gracilibacillus ureilyticus TaxID=531814 RepID=A0A1H9VUD2_9BACI|nr:hypothetical protein SAMN04487944_12812 [Gracilibacillus ureilyticus]
MKQANLSGKKILDCPAGACSFTAVGSAHGHDITACDIAYYHPVDQLKEKGFLDIEHVMYHMEKAKSNYDWDYFGDVDGLNQHRVNALKACAEHMEHSPEKYIPVTLPVLPFTDDEFDILLSAHFLFMYSDRLDFDFHRETMDELLRVTKEEIRIFPLVDLAGKRYEQLDELINYLQQKGCITEERKADYHFQRNANTILRIIK